MQINHLNTSPSLLASFLREMRDVTIQKDAMRFRKNMERIGEIMAYELSRSLNYTPVTIDTPLDKYNTVQLRDKLVIATVFRAGLPFHQGFLNYFDTAENAFVSAYRKYKDALKFDVMVEYIASPSLDGKTLILVDPMLASGSSMELAYKALLTKGTPSSVHFVSIIASQTGVNYLQSNLLMDNATVWVAAIDPELNEHSYIVPGLGDAGDLAFGEKL